MKPALRHQYLDAMGIQRWVPRDAGIQTDSRVTAEVTPPKSIPGTDDINSLDWDSLRLKVESCTACGLHESRTQTVFGVGNTQADWMIIGEAPGAEEDRQGEPFVGRAGQLLTAMLQAIGLQRDQVYIANMLKCRPPGNRDPHADEIEHCMKYLYRQIDLIQPKMILVVGRIAAQSLLHTSQPVGKLRAKLHKLADREIPLVVTYHPAYLLRSPAEKRKAWQDLCLARAALEKNA
jgi:DNA polymerase